MADRSKRTESGGHFFQKGTDRVALQILGWYGEDHIERPRVETRVKLASDDETIAAIVSFAAEDDDALALCDGSERGTQGRGGPGRVHGTGAKLDPSGARPGRSPSDIGTPYTERRTMGSMDLGLTGARALVGGGSRGLGGAIAETLAAVTLMIASEPIVPPVPPVLAKKTR